MPVKREYSSESGESLSDIDKDIKPSLISTPKTNTPTKNKNKSPSKKPKTNNSPTTSNLGKKMGSWSGEELKLLYSIMCPKKTGINWSEVASQIEGRDTKACQNKWARMQSKIMQAIEDMGE
ncbi:hypothetical protein I302_103757 [Kwoniella bestiolae CBS 10118]|uniref:Myb-like domain-containing protein n=1 Tax=Kwoniella bestiolae CBS 10118 TaxID=1296100 RepID=A0A1B9G9D1_9TREE|nr:hypothetical protein I302_02460 [Kwoniella bestiolae CBS 10118]OCF27617.1 hypothetical protein I302_02460 [Kwoniella bestiolae CBS 10118]